MADATTRTAPAIEIGGGHHLFLRDWGSGPPVLLMAGWGMDSAIWGATMLDLAARGHRTIAYDRRGHGRSTDPGCADFDLLADDLARVIGALALERVTLVAHSGAAGEAIRYVTRHGHGRLARVVLVGATGPAMLEGPDNPGGLPAEMVAASIDQQIRDLPGWIDANAEPFAPGATRRALDAVADMILGTSRRILLDFQRAIAATDLRPELAALALPVTLIHGDRDASAPIDLTARRYAALIEGAELVVYDGAGHGVMVTHAARLAGDIAARTSHIPC